VNVVECVLDVDRYWVVFGVLAEWVFHCSSLGLVITTRFHLALKLYKVGDALETTVPIHDVLPTFFFGLVVVTNKVLYLAAVSVTAVVNLFVF
jgi:hypothetical protein